MYNVYSLFLFLISKFQEMSFVRNYDQNLNVDYLKRKKK